MKKIVCGIVVGLLISACFGAFLAQAENEGIAVTTQDRYQRNLERWQSLSEAERQAIRDKASQLTPEERGQLKAAQKKFKELPPDQRKMLRQRQGKFRGMSEDLRKDLRQRYRRFRQMDPEQRQEFRKRMQERREEFRSEKARSFQGQGRSRGKQQELNKPALPDQQKQRQQLSPERQKELVERLEARRERQQRRQGIGSITDADLQENGLKEQGQK